MCPKHCYLLHCTPGSQDVQSNGDDEVKLNERPTVWAAINLKCCPTQAINLKCCHSYVLHSSNQAHHKQMLSFLLHSTPAEMASQAVSGTRPAQSSHIQQKRTHIRWHNEFTKNHQCGLGFLVAGNLRNHIKTPTAMSSRLSQGHVPISSGFEQIKHI